jgi:hypothetical protein
MMLWTHHKSWMNITSPNKLFFFISIGLIFFFIGFLFDVLYLSSLEYGKQPTVGLPHFKFLRNTYSYHDQNSFDIPKVLFPAPITNFTSKSPVPVIVEAWRKALVDWHDLIPAHNSKWERFGTPQGEGKLSLLVNKEMQVTDFLTQYHESGLSSRYGHNHGRLSHYAACDVFKSACSIHSQEECITNDFCEWNNAMSLCIDRSAATDSSSNRCAVPKMIGIHGITPVKDPTTCKLWIDDPTLLIDMDSEAQVRLAIFS